MDCREYINDFVAADADGELSPDEHRLAGAHLAQCAKCRAQLAEERALKALLKERLRKAALPSEVQAAMRAALDREETALAPPLRFAGVGAKIRRPQMWAPILALAASIVFVLMMRDRLARQASIPQFDAVIQKYTRFEKHFEPNVPSQSYGAVSQHYYAHNMPAFLWNFSPYGFQLVGGRIDSLADGRPATYTFYRGPKGALMCTRFQFARFILPPGGRELRTDQYLYDYKGLSLVLSIDYQRHWICILMSRVPADEFADEVASLDG